MQRAQFFLDFRGHTPPRVCTRRVYNFSMLYTAVSRWTEECYEDPEAPLEQEEFFGPDAIHVRATRPPDKLQI